MLVNNWYTSRKLIDTYSQKEFHLILIGGLQANPLRPGPVLKLLNSILTNIQKLQSTHLPRLFMTIKYILVIRKCQGPVVLGTRIRFKESFHMPIRLI